MTGIRTLFEEKEEDYYKLVIFIAIVILNMTKIKRCQSKNTLMNLGHI